MHKEIQIKQFLIVTTHWWPKTWNEQFVWENEQYLYCFLPLVHNHVPSDLKCAHTSGVWRVCARVLAHAAFTRGVGVNAWRRACLKRGADATLSANGGVSQSDRLMQIPNPVHATQRSMWLVVVTMTARQHHASDTPSVKRWRRRARARAHTRHTGCVCALRSLGHGLCTRGKKQYKYCSFSHTNCSFQVLGINV